MGHARDRGDQRIEFIEGGDPGTEVVAAITAVLTRPIVLVEEQAEGTGPSQSAWVRAARLEAVVPGRHITTTADLAWRR